MKRDGVVDNIQTRGFFSSIFNGAADLGQDIVDGTETATTAVENTVIDGSDKIDDAFTRRDIDDNDIDD